ncbi:MAG: hypothetical protein CVU84_00030 [Firmicutes bacterium HGW-Firmicutes-1]|jgi:hypothetical protein|nr:MAG: hypothetical protein CVU84_00030 [Firmicutes bacterium HGW-Firmicutes-1]
MFNDDCFNHLNYKFKNYAKQSKLGNNTILATVFQPPMANKFFILFNRIITTSHVHILTNTELVIIEEDNKKNNRKVNYGGIWTFIPLNKISKIMFHENSTDGKLILSVFQADKFHIDSIYSIEYKENLMSFVKTFNEMQNE